ncbi:toll/interleukin-1 receptor domain-containing protein [Alcaligenes sp. SMD-FA]|uniref:toll/interleukin-1 receptor domain-containing protein n=1 Tax=Alcaligenes sp. SMD-FA TaxID=2991054 RepID=UPI0022277BB8|nr:toll/interleukin-1 receptor domain-containing protein [Alcaligenes sp. SMD-FA]UYY86944.1 toll/interleukin-1 receptor domain-containing protein [Alcaligenes sp. SMD-FA]
MAKIYISYQRTDQMFVTQLAQRLKAAGHSLTYDIDTLAPGTDWRTTLDQGLKTSEIFVVVISESTSKSQYVLAEVGAARAYAADSGRMLIVPVIIDDSPLPLSLQDIQAIIQPDKNIDEISQKIEVAVSTFIGRRAAIEVKASAVAQQLQKNAASYIQVAINSLAGLEVRDRRLGYLWYMLGFLSLVAGIWFAVQSLTATTQQTTLPTESLILAALKALLVIGLLGACAKYAFSLGKSYASEALKCSDRIHAIRFGEFYLQAFGENTQWAELKEVFQHWNIDRNSSFSTLESSSFDPKFIESTIEFAKLLQSKSGRN